MLDFAKIPAKLSTTDKEVVKTLAVYFCLKQLYYNGLLYDWHKRRRYYAEALNCSVNALKYKERWLIREGLAWFDGKHLQLCSYASMRKRYSIQSKRFEKIQCTDVRDMELFLYACAVKENLRQQKFNIKSKITAYEILNLKAAEQFGIFGETDNLIAVLLKKARQRTGDARFIKIMKQLFKFGGKQIYERYERAYYTAMSSYVNLPEHLINPIATLSCVGTGFTCLGSTNPSTGYYLQLRLINAGMLTKRGEQVRVTKLLTKQASMYEPSGVCGKYRTLANRINVEF